jgi:hypothetical protein
MSESQRLTRKKVLDNPYGRGRVATNYTSDATKQAITIQLAAYEDTGLSPAEVAALQMNPDRPSVTPEEADIIEAYRNGRMLCPQSCASCGHYPGIEYDSAFCEKAGRRTRKLQYCSGWIIGGKRNES